MKSTLPVIEFKGGTVSVVVITVRSLDLVTLRAAAVDLFGDEAFFDGDPGLLNLAQLPPEAVVAGAPDWAGLAALFARHGLDLVGVRGGDPVLMASARASGLAAFGADERRPAAVQKMSPAPEAERAVAAAAPSGEPQQQAAAAIAAAAPPALATPPLIVERPLRSGQQVYARGRDLVLLAVVNPGAEAIADGCIYSYAPLRGRALAGAAGDVGARILTTCFAAELVSVAGAYRKFDDGIPAQWARAPVCVKSEGDRLLIERLQLD